MTNDRRGQSDTRRSEDPSAGMDAELTRMETCLETPVVPGELPSWIAALEHSCAELEVPLRREIEDNHPAELKQIAREGPDLLRQVEQLRAEDAELLERHASFLREVHRFRERAELAEPHESKLDPHVESLVKDGLDLVIRIRMQQQAIGTWMMEAFQRDTGVGD